MPLTFDELVSASTIGTRTSPIIDISLVKRIKSSIITIVTNLPANTSVLVESNLSLDGGNTWLGWKTLTSGNSIPDLTAGLDVSSAYIQFRYTLTAYYLHTPEVVKTSFTIDASYLDAEWISPAINTQDFSGISDTSSITWDVVLNGGTFEVYTRSRKHNDGLWGDWTAQTKDAKPSVYDHEIQLKAVLKPLLTSTTPIQLDSIGATLIPSGKHAVWVSDVIDVSQALDKSSGHYVTNTLLGDGQQVVYSRSKSTQDGTWSAWNLALVDGTLTHPPDNFIQLMIILSGTTIELKELTVSFDGSASTVPILTGMTPRAEYDFTILKDILIIVNGNDAPRKWDAITASPELLGGTPPIMSMVETHQNRIWGIEAENPSRVRYSGILKPEEWDILDFIDFNPEDGDYITALMRYGQNLIVSKKRSMAVLTGDKSSNYAVVWLEGDHGATGKNAITSADKYVAFVAQDGIRFSDLTTSVLATERLLPSWENINHRRLNQAAMVYWRHYLLVALPSKNSLYNNIVWAYDFLRNSWAIYTGWTISNFVKFHQYGEDVLLATDSMEGQVYEIMVDIYDDAIPVEYKWRSKDFHFKYPERYKLFRNIFLDLEGTKEASNIEMDLIVDGVVVGTYTDTLPAGEGVKHTKRVLPPVYGAVLGRELTLELRGRCGIQSISIEYVVRGIYPGGDV